VFGVLIGDEPVPASVTNRLRGHRAVVILVPSTPAATHVEEVIDDQALTIVVAVTVTAHDLATWGRLRIEVGSKTDHASPIDVAGIERVIQRPTVRTSAEDTISSGTADGIALREGRGGSHQSCAPIVSGLPVTRCIAGAG
jgi:hypothetical protein